MKVAMSYENFAVSNMFPSIVVEKSLLLREAPAPLTYDDIPFPPNLLDFVALLVEKKPLPILPWSNLKDIASVVTFLLMDDDVLMALKNEIVRAFIQGFKQEQPFDLSDLPDHMEQLCISKLKERYVLYHAAQKGSVPFLEFLHGLGHSFNVKITTLLVKAGNLAGLQWAIEKGCPCHPNAPYSAAKMGHVEVLQWLTEKGYKSDESIQYVASKKGHLEILKWLFEKGSYMYYDDICPTAARYGHKEILEWSMYNGWKIDSLHLGDRICASAVEGGHFELLKWLRSIGCPWGENTSEIAVMYAAGSLRDDKGCRRWDILKWVVENNCPHHKIYLQRYERHMHFLL